MVSLTSFAQVSAKISSDKVNNLFTGTPAQVLQAGLNTFYFIAGIVAVVAIILAGFYFVTAGGNPTTITKAKNTILYAVAGLVIIIIAFAITQFIIGSF